MIRAPEVFAPAVRGVLRTLPSTWRHFVCFSLLRFQLRLVRVAKAFFKDVLSFHLFWLGILVRIRSLVPIADYAASQLQPEQVTAKLNEWLVDPGGVDWDEIGMSKPHHTTLQRRCRVASAW